MFTCKQSFTNFFKTLFLVRENRPFLLSKVMSQFDFFEHLLKHGLEHIIEEILLLLPVEDLLCRVNAVSRYEHDDIEVERLSNAMNF